MKKRFCVTGTCVPEKHYMVDIQERIDRIVEEYIENGLYFTINRARQYGKTTTLFLLRRALKREYLILNLSFEASDEYFQSAAIFAEGLVMDIAECLREQDVDSDIIDAWGEPISGSFPMKSLGMKISVLCRACNKKIVLMIDEVDKSSDNQIFLSFLGLLREKYLKWKQEEDVTFQSVILAGVYDVKTLKIKLRPQEEMKYNSPWNIAANFNIDMSFSPEDIAGMLREYEADYHTSMDILAVSQLIYDYTSGYPFLVSRICQLAEESIAGSEHFMTRTEAWSREGILFAIKLLLSESNTLFDDMTKKLLDYPELKEMIQGILFGGIGFPYKRETPVIDLGVTFGILKEDKGNVAIANRIFETHFYDLLLAEMAITDKLYMRDSFDKNQFIMAGMLQMDLVMKKFYDYCQEIYSDSDQQFLEKNGRKLFLLYLKPIINGSGNYYIEARTRDNKRTDVVVDYKGQQFVIELKIWHGNEYNSRGEAQLFEYLDFYGIEKGYLLSFNFNKKKKTGVREVEYKGKRILEVVV